jgi:hypothetical protein
MYAMLHPFFPRGSKERWFWGECRMTFESFWCQLLYFPPATFPSTRMFQRRDCLILLENVHPVFIQDVARIAAHQVYFHDGQTESKVSAFSTMFSRLMLLSSCFHSRCRASKYRTAYHVYFYDDQTRICFVIFPGVRQFKTVKFWLLTISRANQHTHAVSFILLNNDNRRYQLWSSQGRCL